MLLPEVRFAAHYGLKSEIALSPKSANSRRFWHIRQRSGYTPISDMDRVAAITEAAPHGLLSGASAEAIARYHRKGGRL
jgi:hypothetical protein